MSPAANTEEVALLRLLAAEEGGINGGALAPGALAALAARGLITAGPKPQLTSAGRKLARELSEPTTHPTRPLAPGLSYRPTLTT